MEEHSLCRLEQRYRAVSEQDENIVKHLGLILKSTETYFPIAKLNCRERDF